MKEQYPGCIKTITGKYVNPFKLLPEDVCIDDIAHSLAMQCRFQGHITQFLSVARHSINAVKMAKKNKEPLAVQLLLLVHDATEAYLVDIPRPYKGAIMIRADDENPDNLISFDEFEGFLFQTILVGLGLSHLYTDENWSRVKHYDNAVLVDEIKLLKQDNPLGGGYNLPDENIHDASRDTSDFFDMFFLLEIKLKHESRATS